MLTTLQTLIITLLFFFQENKIIIILLWASNLNLLLILTIISTAYIQLPGLPLRTLSLSNIKKQIKRKLLEHKLIINNNII